VFVLSFLYFVLLDIVKVLMYKYWSFEVTAYLWPVPSRRAKLQDKRAQAICMHPINFILF